MSEWTLDTLKELFEQRFTEMDRAVDLQAAEYARRLEVLNHAHELAREKEHDFIGREAFETFVQRSADIVGRLESVQAKMIGALILLSVILPALVFFVTRKGL